MLKTVISSSTHLFSLSSLLVLIEVIKTIFDSDEFIWKKCAFFFLSSLLLLFAALGYSYLWNINAVDVLIYCENDAYF